MVNLSRIGQIAINVRDARRAVEFYRDVLGMELLFEVPRMGFFDCDGIRLMLSEVDAAESGPLSSIVYFGVDDIQQVFEKLNGAGVEFTSPPRQIATVGDHNLWMAFFKDPDGNILGLMSEVAIEPSSRPAGQ